MPSAPPSAAPTLRSSPRPYYSKHAKADIAHPEYVKRAWHWRYYQLCVLGGRDYYEPDLTIDWRIQYTENEGKPDERLRYMDTVLPSFLWPHRRESTDDYSLRVIKSSRVNLCEPPVSAFRRTVYSKPITRDEGSALLLRDVWGDVDRRSSQADEWMAEGLAGALTFGHMFAAVDVDALRDGETSVQSLSDERELGIRPYVIWHSPLTVPNWSIDEYGVLNWITLCEDYATPRLGPWDAEQVEARYRTWYRDHWELALPKQDDTRMHPCPVCGERLVLDAGWHGLGVVPVEVLYASRIPGMLDPIGAGLVGQIADADRRVFNLCSQKDEIIDDTGFPFVAVADASGTITRGLVSTRRAFAYDPGAGGAPPTYVQPSPDSVRVLQEEIAALVQMIRAATGLTRGVSDQSIASRSGTALLIETQDKASLIKGFATEAEDFERRLWTLVAKRAGQSPDGIVVRYPSHYDVRTLGDELDEAEKLLKLDPGAEVKAEVVKGLVAKMLAHLPKGRLDELVESVEAGGADMDDAQGGAPVGMDVPPGNGDPRNPGEATPPIPGAGYPGEQGHNGKQRPPGGELG